MTPTSRRSFGSIVWSVALAFAIGLSGGEGGLLGERPPAALAAPAAAPDNSITLLPFLTGLTSPVLITNAADGTGRLFVVERAGVIKLVVSGAVRPTPFLNITSKVESTSGEQGLLGLAFHPNYENNGRFFVFYTAKPPGGQTTNKGSNTLEEYQVSGNPEIANATPIRTLFALPDRAENHNAGMLGFSPNDAAGYLYVSTGDEGGGGDQFGNSQNLNSLYAKILRLDVDNIPSGQMYGIPPTNPFVGQGGVRPEIWAYGFRNPWRWSFDRQTGDIWIGDVGQNVIEEVDFEPATDPGGRNYGWDAMEGTRCVTVDPPPAPPCNAPSLTLPIFEYDHSVGRCTVIGGYRWRADNSRINGLYFFGDFCTGEIFSFDPASEQVVDRTGQLGDAAGTDFSLVSFGEDGFGRVLIVNRSNGGRVHRIVPVVPPPSCGIGPELAAILVGVAWLRRRRALAG
jgi:glucose/arabinose dehydrogenase